MCGLSSRLRISICFWCVLGRVVGVGVGVLVVGGSVRICSAGSGCVVYCGMLVLVVLCLVLGIV